jgi:hypothetical protein
MQARRLDLAETWTELRRAVKGLRRKHERGD